MCNKKSGSIRIRIWLKYIGLVDIIKDSGSYPFLKENILRIAMFFQGPKMKVPIPSAICHKRGTIPS